MSQLLDVEHLRRFIVEQGIAAEVIELPVPTPTVQAAAQAVGTTSERIVKSLLFVVRGQPLLAIANGPAHMDKRPLAAHFSVGRKQVRLADAESVLTLTGYSIGAMPPFGHRQPLPTFMDPGLFAFDEVYAGGGAIDALLRISPQEMLRVTGAHVLDLTRSPHSPTP